MCRSPPGATRCGDTTGATGAHTAVDCPAPAQDAVVTSARTSTDGMDHSRRTDMSSTYRRRRPHQRGTAPVSPWTRPTGAWVLPRGVEDDGGRGGDVERVDSGGHRDADDPVGHRQHPRGEAVTLGAEAIGS